MPQLQINQGPQDALLYDNSRSYFTNVGYVRTSNFQVEYREVDPQNNFQWGSTVQYVIPKAADLLGPVDLRVKIPAPTTPENAGIGSTDTAPDAATRAFTQWVDELGFAMIEKCTFSVGSNDIETITGEQMQIKNELMTSDEQRLGYEHVLKTGKSAFLHATNTDNNELPGTNETGIGPVTGSESSDTTVANKSKTVNTDYTRIIGLACNTKVYASGDRDLIIPLNLFFTKHVSQWFPLAAVAGCNDIRISIKFRALKELIQFGGTSATGNTQVVLKMPTFGQVSARLMCHYCHVTGPEATTLMNKEHVRLLKLWQHSPHTIAEGQIAGGNKIDIDLSFLHPVTTLIVTIRRANDMNTTEGWTIATDSATGKADQDTAQKGFFFYHGDGTPPNYDGENATASNGDGTVKVKGLKLTLNGQERHPGLADGIDATYLQSRLLPMLHSNSNSVEKQLLATAGTTLGSITQQRFGMQGSKNIFVYPFSLNPEGSNPSGAVNFSKVSHAKLQILLDKTDVTNSKLLAAANGGVSGAANKSPLRVDVYGMYYNWLQIKDGRALLSFA